MKSLKELYRIGPGPSSSHTLGPMRACLKFKEAHQGAACFQAELFGSLALTGKGHHSDQIIIDTLAPIPCTVLFSQAEQLPHPNTMKLHAIDAEGKIYDTWTICSIGGGALHILEIQDEMEGKEIYPQKNFQEIKAECLRRKIYLRDYVDQYEQIDDYLSEIMDAMMKAVERGLGADGYLPGKLHLLRVGRNLYRKALTCNDPIIKEKMLLCAYAYSVSEENAAGGYVVTAPTLGSSGILPAIVYYFYHDKGYSKQQIITGLKIAGIIGNLIKQNATISGAQGGCQAEIGAACAMGAAMIASLQGLNDAMIEYAAEIGIEHHLGLTCDPVGGYVMIPCIERNAVATLRAMDAAFLSGTLSELKGNRVSLDMVINTMNYTGRKLAIELKETSLGGLATVVPLEDKIINQTMIVYASKSGNTKQLADALEKEMLVRSIPTAEISEEEIASCQSFLIGYWVNQGNCDEETKKLLTKLHGKQIFLFGTLGAKDSGNYYDAVKQRVEALLGDNELIGHYLCQGKIRPEVIERYRVMAKQKPDDEHLQMQLENYEAGITHPDQNDIQLLLEAYRCMKSKLHAPKR
ncbi:flavodoxin family protein BilS [Massilicoli timonensis]|nr:L-serine ammonia-lyase, iron-sulfur-dependent, subunit alpha [Candidatus Onthosoma merdavium]